MSKYSKKAQRTIGKAVRRMKRGTLKSGSGETVTDRDQAIAIGISEAREKGLKVPKEKKPAKKTVAKNAKKKTAPKKKAAAKKKAPAKKKAAAKKSTAKKKTK